MTTLYRPVLIESAEQAEALPVGTLAREGANVIIKSFDGRWWWAGLDGVVQPQAEAAVGWTALVPIEAEEEWKTLHEGAWHLKAHEDDARNDANAYGTRRRYTTEWEETP